MSVFASIIQSTWNCGPGDGEKTWKAAEAAQETNERFSSGGNYEGVCRVILWSPLCSLKSMPFSQV